MFVCVLAVVFLVYVTVSPFVWLVLRVHLRLCVCFSVRVFACLVLSFCVRPPIAPSVHSVCAFIGRFVRSLLEYSFRVWRFFLSDLGSEVVPTGIGSRHDVRWQLQVEGGE